MGAGVIGIPYAFRETGLCAGWAFILLSAVMGCKSLRLLVETAKHVDAPSYESKFVNHFIVSFSFYFGMVYNDLFPVVSKL